MRTLILNWRDPRNPRAGGAESYTHEVARRLVANGDEVEWFAAAFPGGRDQEVIDGVRVVRAGRQWTVHFHAARRYRGRLRGCFDVVIDEINTVPFFTPLWANVPVFMLMHQLAREVWWYESPFPVNVAGYIAEPYYLRVYRQVPVFTVANSTERDLRELGFTGPIVIAPNGLEPIATQNVQKASVPTFLYVGRLASSKRVDHILEAFSTFHQVYASSRLWLIGDGPDRRRLESLARRLGIASVVEFCGRVATTEKHRCMAQAHALLMSSAREGWGLVVTEANACGTLAIVYDVPGLRDSVRHLETGLVVRPTPHALAEGMLHVTRDPALCRRLAYSARTWSDSFTFDRTAAIIRSELERHL